MSNTIRQPRSNTLDRLRHFSIRAGATLGATALTLTLFNIAKDNGNEDPSTFAHDIQSCDSDLFLAKGTNIRQDPKTHKPSELGQSHMRAAENQLLILEEDQWYKTFGYNADKNGTWVGIPAEVLQDNLLNGSNDPTITNDADGILWVNLDRTDSEISNNCPS